MREANFSRAVSAVLVMLTASVVRGQCVTTERAITQPASFPSRVAGPIASTGSILGLAKSDITTGIPAIFFATFDGSLNPLTDDRQIADTSANGATNLIWNGSEFGLFYQTPTFALMLQSIATSGNPIGAAIPIVNHAWSPDDEFDVAWSPVRNAYAIARTVTQGAERGLWLTVVSRNGVVIADTNITFFVSPPTLPRVAALPDGSFAISWVRSGTEGRVFAISIVSQSGLLLKSTVFSSREVTAARIATDGNSILVIFSSPVTGGTELRVAQFDLAGNTIKSDSAFLTGSGVDILPLQLQWNPTLSEWTLTYNDAQLGLLVFPGTIRLRRFTSLTAMPSDTLLSPNPSHSRLVDPYPIVFMNGGYIASIQRVISRQEGSESYLVKSCPFFVTASTNTPIVPPFVPVTFTGIGSGGTPGYQFEWQFGDNAITKGQVVQHVYQLPGTYTVTLTGTDAAGASSITRLTVVVRVGKARAVRH